MILLGTVTIALLNCGWDAHDRFEIGLHADRIARAPFHFDPDTRVVTALEREAEHTGIVKGATVTALNGSPYTGRLQWTSSAPPGAVLRVGFRRPDGTEGTASITLAASAAARSLVKKNQVWQQFLLFNVSSLLCLLIGGWVVFARPADPNAWLLLLLLLFPTAFFSFGTGLATGGWFLFRGLYYQLLQVIGPVALLPFAIYFPERSRLDVRLPWVKWVVVGAAFACGAIGLRLVAGQYLLGGNASWFVKLAGFCDALSNALDLLCVLLYLAILVSKLRTASTKDARRRLRVLLTGTSLGLGGLLLVFVLLPHLGFNPGAPGHIWAIYLGSILFLLAPFSLAYVVLVQRAMDVRILIRQGTRYALAKATLWSVRLLLMTLFSYELLTSLLAHRQTTQAKLWELALFVLLLLLLRSGFRKDSSQWLDKRFFRETYDAEQVLSQLSDEVRRYTESAPLLHTVAERVSATLHVTQIGMLLQSGDRYCLAESAGTLSTAADGLGLQGNASAIRKLRTHCVPLQLYRNDPDAWYMLADSAERHTLDALGAELLLPLSGRERLMGVMALGPKQSEAAYSKSDLNLLQVLANQTGMALEVSELAHSLAAEAAQRERTTRELEVAREVQERLLPQAMPSIAAGSVAGASRPAQGVGGDYFDVFAMRGGRLGLAIGDVSGKGISAALLMAGLRASLRGLTLDAAEDFAAVMEKLNRLVYEASAPHRYATFFFGAFDPETKVLECVNAGHNAPLLLRQRPQGPPAVLRIEADGPVVGLLPTASYSQQRVVLQAGDLLIAYTDGISEAMTVEEEEWGEERMLAAACKASAQPAQGILEAIFAEADAFTAGAAQYDDMSLLLFKLDPPER